MRLALQENAAQLLEQLKEKISDKTMSFTFYTVDFFKRLRYRKVYLDRKEQLQGFIAKYQFDKVAAEEIDIEPAVWENIKKGVFMPSKNLLLSLALAAHISFEDTQTLLQAFDYELDFALEKDVVIAYLLKQKIFNRDMMDAAFAEYKVRHLYLR